MIFRLIDKLVTIPYCNQDDEVLVGELTEPPRFFTLQLRIVSKRLNISTRLPVDYKGRLCYVDSPTSPQKHN